MKRRITATMLIAATTMSVMACNGKSAETQAPTSETLITTETTATTDTLDTEESTQEGSAVDRFIEIYNDSYDDKITDISDLDIQGDDYRTEYRLGAFKKAVGKKGILDQNEIEIITYGYSNSAIRFYMTTDSMDDATKICRNIIHLLDNSISDDEITEEFDSLDTTKYASLYLGDTGYIGGYIDNCTFMIDCSKIKF